MLKVDNVQVYGFDPAIHGMRNPMNSWNKSDSYIYVGNHSNEYVVGDKDLDLMQRLCKAGTEHRKYLRMIPVWMDITAPLYWWKEFDTYKVGTVANSTSTMHKIHAKKFTLDDFSCEHMKGTAMFQLEETIDLLNEFRDEYNSFNSESVIDHDVYTKKELWWQMIQLLPSSYNQTRTVMLNYEVALNIIKQRTGHKLDEWHTLVAELENLPYMAEIRGIEHEQSTEESTKH